MDSTIAVEFSIPVSISPEDVILIAEAAGQEILAVYNDGDLSQLAVEQKADQSPLTVADKRANVLICKELQKIAPHVPIVSEETKLVPYEVRKGYCYWWCVDPLDGTKEFIKRNGQFTVNIALVRGNRPILGVVHTPCTRTTHWATAGRGAFVRSAQSQVQDSTPAQIDGPDRSAGQIQNFTKSNTPDLITSTRINSVDQSPDCGIDQRTDQSKAGEEVNRKPGRETSEEVGRETSLEVGRETSVEIGQETGLETNKRTDRPIYVAEFSELDDGLVIVGSASHQSKETEEFVAKYRNPEVKAMGSSLKFMLVAEGKAHVYPRLAPTSEWDSCASQIIVEEAGGEVLRFPELTSLSYGKENPLNPHFVVFGKRRT